MLRRSQRNKKELNEERAQEAVSQEDACSPHVSRKRSASAVGPSKRIAARSSLESKDNSASPATVEVEPEPDIDSVIVTSEQVRWFRMRQAGFVKRYSTPQEAIIVNGGMQAQLESAAYIALWNRADIRGARCTSDALTDLLVEQRELVKLWSHRQTLHLHHSADWPVLSSSNAFRLRRFIQIMATNGVSEDVFTRAVEQSEVHLRRHKTMTRKNLREMGFPEPLCNTYGGVFAELTRRGVACHSGKKQGSENVFAWREHWLPQLKWSPPHEDDALAELFRRYFGCFGPASLDDALYWHGSLVAHARRAFERIRPELVQVSVSDASYAERLYILRRDVSALQAVPPPRAQWPVKLLGKFDTLLLAHRDKAWLIDAEFKPLVWRPAAQLEAVVLEHGRLAGVWRYERTRSALKVTVTPFRALSASTVDAIRTEADALASFFGCDECKFELEPPHKR